MSDKQAFAARSMLHEMTAPATVSAAPIADIIEFKQAA
jgi:hypothetical protein